MNEPLKNSQQERFAQEAAKGQTLGAAYIAAGYKASDPNACRLAAKADVAARISWLKSLAAERAVVDAAWLLTRLAEEAKADVADLYTEDGRIKPVKDWPLIWRQGLVAGLEVETTGEGAGHLTKVKLSDRIKRLELLGKHVDVQAFKEKVEHSGTIGITVLQEDAEL